jgi:starch phosphorylase
MNSRHYLPRKVPDELRFLVELALDLRWSWYHGHDALWREVDQELWESTANPWLILESVSDLRLQQLAQDPGFLRELQRHQAHRQKSLGRPTWFGGLGHAGFAGSIAYFSMEFGICESLPIYAGGLGVLAGDLLKTACDLGVPVIGIGLLYQQGYFRQKIDASGNQLEFYPYNDPTMLPVVPLRDDQGQWLRVPIQLPGRQLLLRAWLAQVGRRSLFLLDSNDPNNDPGDRGITAELYGGGTEMRLQQEIVLGIGGWRLLHMLDIDCPICHLNEGHAAFAVLERARLYMLQHDCDFETARCATRVGNLFTSHTPVSAGFDRFPVELIRLYLESYAGEMGLRIDDMLNLGRDGNLAGDGVFNMASLAVRCAGAVNAVSCVHGEVSRHIYQPLFPRWPTHEVPVGHVTNGVHVPSWDSPSADELWTRSCGKRRWRGELDAIEQGLCLVSDNELWQLRCDSRRRMLKFIAKRLHRQWRSHGGSDRDRPTATGILLNPEVLTLGLARRFTEYKRTDLLLTDTDRLMRLLCDRDRPVQLVISGKAHPKDHLGKQMLRRWYDFIRQPELEGRIVFIEDYDLNVATELTRGVDVWINTPRPPSEACGTSGMKVLVNGGLNLSVRDGWWAEAHTPSVGWAIDVVSRQAGGRESDRHDAAQIYDLLQNEIVPLFYDRDRRGVPVEWVRLMRDSMARLTGRYSSNRMLREYTERYYLPLAKALHERADRAVELRRQQLEMATHWQGIHFGNMAAETRGNRHYFDVQLYLNELPAEWVRVEIYADADSEGGVPVCRQPLQPEEPLIGTRNAYSYRGTLPADRPLHAYTARVLPEIDGLRTPLEFNLILWQR